MKFTTILNNVATIAVPSYRRTIFQTIITGLLVGKNRRTISGIFQQFACLFVGSSITQKRFYTLMNSSSIKWIAIWKYLVDLLSPCVLTKDRLLVALDDSSYGKTGRKISGCTTHFDHANKLNVSSWIFGHCRVVVGLLTFTHGRWACLPISQKNFVPAKEKGKKKKIHNDLLKKTVLSRKQKRHQEWQKTKSGIAAELVNGIRHLFKAPILVVCDSWFGTYTLLRELRRKLDLPSAHILSRIRISCVLYDLPVFPKDSKRGRNRKYGEKLPSIEELAGQMRDGAKTQPIFLYGKLRDCTYSERICVSKAMKCKVKILFIHRSNGRFFPLVTTDLTLTAKQIIEYYSARWKIESAFKELKHELGAIDSQCRNQNAVENHFNLCCLAMTMAWIYTLKQSRAPKRHYPTRHSHAFAFADSRREIARELGHDDNFLTLCPESLKPAVKLIRQHIFREAA